MLEHVPVFYWLDGMAEELTAEELIEKANEPAYMMVDGSQVTSKRAADIIALDRYARQKAAAEGASSTNSFLGMRVRQMRPGGCG